MGGVHSSFIETIDDQIWSVDRRSVKDATPRMGLVKNKVTPERAGLRVGDQVVRIETEFETDDITQSNKSCAGKNENGEKIYEAINYTDFEALSPKGKMLLVNQKGGVGFAVNRETGMNASSLQPPNLGPSASDDKSAPLRRYSTRSLRENVRSENSLEKRTTPGVKVMATYNEIGNPLSFMGGKLRGAGISGSVMVDVGGEDKFASGRQAHNPQDDDTVAMKEGGLQRNMIVHQQGLLPNPRDAAMASNGGLLEAAGASVDAEKDVAPNPAVYVDGRMPISNRTIDRRKERELKEQQEKPRREPLVAEGDSKMEADQCVEDFFGSASKQLESLTKQIYGCPGSELKSAGASSRGVGISLNSGSANAGRRCLERPPSDWGARLAQSDGALRLYLNGEKTEFGRSWGSFWDSVVPEVALRNTISRRHFLVETNGTAFVVRCVSSNGLFVDGEFIRRGAVRALQHGSTVGFLSNVKESPFFLFRFEIKGELRRRDRQLRRPSNSQIVQSIIRRRTSTLADWLTRFQRQAQCRENLPHQ